MKIKISIFVMSILAIATLIYVADINEYKSEEISKYRIENLSETFTSLNDQEIEKNEMNFEDVNKSIYTSKKSLNRSDDLAVSYLDDLSTCVKIPSGIGNLSEEGLEKLSERLKKVNPDISRKLNIDQNNMEFEQIRRDLEEYKKESENNTTLDLISFKEHEKQYEWKNHKLHIKISDKKYRHYKNLHHNQSTYSDFVIYEDSQIKELTNYFNSISDEEERANCILSFVQNIPFVLEPDGEDFWKYPIETLIEGGDCEDHAFLFASIAKQSGYDVAIIIFHEHKIAAIMLGKPPKVKDAVYYLFDENKYYACETSGGVYPVGKVSNEYEGEYYYIFPV